MKIKIFVRKNWKEDTRDGYDVYPSWVCNGNKKDKEYEKQRTWALPTKLGPYAELEIDNFISRENCYLTERCRYGGTQGSNVIPQMDIWIPEGQFFIRTDYKTLGFVTMALRYGFSQSKPNDDIIFKFTASGAVILPATSTEAKEYIKDKKTPVSKKNTLPLIDGKWYNLSSVHMPCMFAGKFTVIDQRTNRTFKVNLFANKIGQSLRLHSFKTKPKIDSYASPSVSLNLDQETKALSYSMSSFCTSSKDTIDIDTTNKTMYIWDASVK